MSSQAHTLPLEAWVHLMSFTDGQTALAMSQCNRRFHSAYVRIKELPCRRSAMHSCGFNILLGDKSSMEEAVASACRRSYNQLRCKALVSFRPAVCVAHVAIHEDDAMDKVGSVFGRAIKSTLPLDCEVVGAIAGGTVSNAGDADPVDIMNDPYRLHVSLMFVQTISEINPIIRTIKRTQRNKFDAEQMRQAGVKLEQLRLSILFEHKISEYHRQLSKLRGTDVSIVGGLGASVFRGAQPASTDASLVLEFYTQDPQVMSVQTAVMDVGSSSAKFEKKLDYLLNDSSQRLNTSLVYRVSCVNRHNAFMEQIYKSTESQLYYQRSAASPRGMEMVGWFAWGEIGPVQSWMIAPDGLNTASKLTSSSALKEGDEVSVGGVSKFDLFGNTSMYAKICLR